jgi:hypothetical protein
VDEPRRQREQSHTGGMRTGPPPFALEGPLDAEELPFGGLAGGPFFAGDGVPFPACPDPFAAAAGVFFFFEVGVVARFGTVKPPGG